MTTRDTPLSAVRMILLESLLSSASAFFSSLVMLFAGVLIFLRMALISPLNSSALPGINFVQAFSIEAMYSPTGGFLGRMAKLGPLDNIFFCVSVRGYWISYVPICSHGLLPYLGFVLIWSCVVSHTVGIVGIVGISVQVIMFSCAKGQTVFLLINMLF